MQRSGGRERSGAQQNIYRQDCGPLPPAPPPALRRRRRGEATRPPPGRRPTSGGSGARASGWVGGAAAAARAVALASPASPLLEEMSRWKSRLHEARPRSHERPPPHLMVPRGRASRSRSRIALVRLKDLLRQLAAGLVGDGECLVQVGAMASHLRVDGRGRECRSGCRIPHRCEKVRGAS